MTIMQINVTESSLHPTSLGTTANNSEEVHPINTNIREALEFKTLQGSCQHMQSLLMALKQRPIEWAKEFIEIRDTIDRKQSSLRSLQSSIVPLKSASLNFSLGSSEKVKEAHARDCNQLCALASNAKLEASELLEQLVTKVAYWETTIMKLTLIE